MFVAAITAKQRTVLDVKSSEVGESGPVVPKDESSNEEVLMEDSHSHGSENGMMSPEAPTSEKRPYPYSNPTFASSRDSNSSSFQDNYSASYLQSLSGTQTKQSTAPSTWPRGSSLDRVDKCSDTPDLDDVDQSTLWSNGISDDIESIASKPDSLNSKASTSHPLGQAGVNYIVAKFTQYDTELHTLYTEASQKLTQSRFIKNNQRLLQSFHRDIVREVQTAPQAEAASFLNSRRRRIAISSDIFQTMIPDDRPPLSLMQREEEFSTLDRYLNNLEAKGDPTVRDASRRPDDEQESSSDEDPEPGSNHHEPSPTASSLQETGNFLVTSQAFVSYKQRLHDFVRPSHGKSQETTAGLLAHSDTTLALQPSSFLGNTDSIAEPELALSEEEVQKEEVPATESYESGEKATSAGTPPVDKESDSITDSDLEIFSDLSPSTFENVGLALPAATIPKWTRVSKWMTDRLWPPRHGSQRIWYLCVSI